MTSKSNVAQPLKNTKINPEAVAKAKTFVMSIVDWTFKTVAIVFFLGTSYGYVSGYIKVHQADYNMSVAGGILIVSVALYLFTRKR